MKYLKIINQNIQEHQEILNSIDNKIKNKINTISKIISNSLKKGGTIFWCGNGGSAANAIHIANDLHYGLGVNANRDGRGLKVEALPANSAVITCLANDTGYENIFSHQLRVKAKKDDLLIVLSGSGNSPNIINVLKEGNEIGMKSYGILGFDGGKCKSLATNSIHFEINDMLISEDIQMIVFNICFQWIVKKYSKNN